MLLPTFHPRMLLCSAAIASTVMACGESSSPSDPQGAGGSAGGTTSTTPDARLVLSEVQSRNAGSWIDESGETDDWVEVFNRSDEPVELSDYALADSSGQKVTLSAGRLAPGATELLWLDDDDQGARHLPFKVSSEGEVLRLSGGTPASVDEVVVPALAENEVFARRGGDGAWERCPYATPRQANPEACSPPEPTELADDVQFESFQLPDDTFVPESFLHLSELSLRPTTGSAFVELVNAGPQPLALEGLEVRISAHAPHLPWPARTEGSAVAVPNQMLAPGAYLSIDVPAAALATLNADSNFEGVVSLFAAPDEAVDRIDFMRWPLGSSIARLPSGILRLCNNATPDLANECDPLASRDVDDRLRRLLTPGDFSALSTGATTVGIVSVKFVVDLEAPGLVHLLAVADYPLHYTFVREQVYRQPALDRCDPTQGDEFYAGWVQFSRDEYFATEGRRFLLGTLSRHTAASIDAVEYSLGDVIGAEQMRLGYLGAVGHSYEPSSWQLHPHDSGQAQKMRAIEGTVPLVPPNAPFRGMKHQALSEGVGFGTLRFVPTAELSTTALGPEVIVVTDSVPNDIPLVGGLITEAFQTPLAHVNVLSQSRGTPNASLRDARTVLADWFGQLVRVEVNGEGVNVTEANTDQASAYWAQFRSEGPPLRPRIDRTVRGVQDLAAHSLASLPALGAKAAQLAELSTIQAPSCGSLDRLRTPENALAIPVVHFSEHFEASGALARLQALEANTEFVADPLVRAAGLSEVRALILQHPVQRDLLSEISSAVQSAFGDKRVRFRSSSNTEDLPNFIGAGLYDSTSAEVNSDERPIDGALRSVWASLYNARAYDERRLASVDERDVAMGVLVHEAFRNELANGVAVSRNLLDPIRGDIYYINGQAGEASVTNPAPGVSTEQVIYRWGRQPPILQQSQSSLVTALRGTPQRVLSDRQVEDIACALDRIHEHFRPLLDPQSENAWFAMEIEFKYLGNDPQLLVKQARPHDFGRTPEFSDCREFL